MGITIYASGKINNVENIPHLIDEMKGIAKKNDWEYNIIDDDFNEPPNVILKHDSGKPGINIDGSLGLKGIILAVDPGSESLAILFDCSGVLTGIMSQISWLESNKLDERFSACKTQFGSIDSHICIIELLDILKKKYISDLVVEDEGTYWTSRDRDLLAEKRAVLEHYISHTEKVISSVEVSNDSDQSSHTVASHIEKALLKADKKRGSYH